MSKLSEEAKEKIEYKTGVVTLLDVLGWKGIWGRKEDAIRSLETLIANLKIKAKEYSRGLLQYKEIETRIFSVSDTIVIITDSSLGEAPKVIGLHGNLCKEAIPLSIDKGIPLRGATAFGDYAISDNESIFVGKAIDESASWHELGDWIGVIQTPSAYYAYDNHKNNAWVECKEPPLKGNLKFQTNAVLWIDSEISLRKMQKSFISMAPIFPEVTAKFTNTTSWISKCIDQLELPFCKHSNVTKIENGRFDIIKCNDCGHQASREADLLDD